MSNNNTTFHYESQNLYEISSDSTLWRIKKQHKKNQKQKNPNNTINLIKTKQKKVITGGGTDN